MATNKRKDAAALFELIDKSTLKVPKGAGALKIPSWWSSKTNPVVSGQSSVVSGGAGVQDEAGGVGPIQPLAKVEGGVVQAGGAENTEQTSPPQQHRLFDPPPANAEPAVSPSIRPPGPGGAVRMGAVESASGKTESGNRGTEESTEKAPAVAAAAKAPSTAGGYAGLGSGRRVFAPQTMGQGQVNRPAWNPDKLRLSSMPQWVLVAGGLAVLLVLLLIIYGVVVSLRGGGSKAPATGTGNSVHSGNVVPLLPAGTQPGVGVTTPGGVHPVTPPLVGDGKAAVYKGGTVPHLPNLYYVWILSDPAEDVVEKDGEFLAQHGIDVSVEVMAQKNSKNVLYQLMSVKGFTTLADAERYRSSIVKIGYQMKDSKNTSRVWDSAYSRKVTAPAK